MAARGRATRSYLFAVGAVVLWSAAAFGQDGGSPQQVTSLADVAKGIKLRLPEGNRKLDNEAIKRLGEGVNLTTAKPQKAAPTPAASAEPWQKRYQEARARVLGLELFLQRAKSRSEPAGSPADAVLQRSIRRAETELEIMRGAPEQVIQQALAAGGRREWFENLPLPEPVFPSWVTRSGEP